MATQALHPGRNRNFHHLRGRYRVLASHRDMYQWSGLNRPTILATIEGLAERRILLSRASVEHPRVWWAIHPKTSWFSEPKPLPVIYFPILGEGV